ncbi:MAG: hypothetical protein ACR5K5_01665 [Wolbachia sp.]
MLITGGIDVEPLFIDRATGKYQIVSRNGHPFIQVVLLQSRKLEIPMFKLEL